MLIDDVYISVKPGDGGDGKVHFLANRHQPKGGPDGGDGGNGGSVIFESVSDISRLNQFRNKKKFEAENGQPGNRQNRHGKNGTDLVIRVPVGTTVAYDNGTQVELTRIGQKIIIAKGGQGGHGNSFFKASDNTTPKTAQPGQKRSWRHLHLTLKLIAQIGLIGLPNAGKTSLLNELTKAHAKVANYPFTTLEPNLGVMENNLVIADIPGLIEGASLGKGLGYKFLKHVERTGILIHCLSSDSGDYLKDYQTVRHELENYSSKLAAKKEIVVFTKSDLVDSSTISQKASVLNTNYSAVSIIDADSIAQLKKLIFASLA